MKPGGPHGVLVLDKPAGPTSSGAMRQVQRLLGGGRAGHAGTLDPAATGVLVLLLGEATKLSQWLVGHDKSYRATVRLGVATDTLDAEGEVVAEAEVPAEALDPDTIQRALGGFVGEMDQVPPAYSAIKRGGRSLMSRARAGEEVVCEPRRVTCHGLSLVAVEGSSLVIDVDCGSGYYVRSLARDLGEALGVPAHLSALRRTRSGPFTADEAVPLDAVDAAHLRPLGEAMPGVPRVVVEDDEVEAVRNGRLIAAREPGERALLFAPDGTALAMASRTEGDLWRVVRGFRFLS